MPQLGPPLGATPRLWYFAATGLRWLFPPVGGPGHANVDASSAAASATSRSSAGAADSCWVQRTAITTGPRPGSQTMPTSLVVP